MPTLLWSVARVSDLWWVVNIKMGVIMKKFVLRGMFAFLLVMGTAVYAKDVRPNSDNQAASGESVDCFYEYNQSNSLCQKTVKAVRSKPAGTVMVGKSYIIKTAH